MSEGVIVAQKPVVAAFQIKRRRFYLLLSSVAFSLWVIAMLVMYFTTVYPERHPSTTNATHTVR